MSLFIDWENNIFGAEPARSYLNNLELFLTELAIRPELARDASTFAHNLCYYRYKAHVIFYQFSDDNKIFVIRILGKRMFIQHP
ncbi:type II toxin-antitoxin system RelE/ParE family toxin [Winogradskyella sp. F6397]|uniref:Type II toxin-antitoxin system RelE/ParE family toxin n=1 Tax=Winogradskyella marina TaxID=2785530 RepID=A0ABS0EIY3_9FLAO|nr:type II toxin-antitoxin system RelE/ParE family toxin [Winogradskyella marina]MBF8150427.1 type II toxin-antitoxin system RelE/ParE family toxin [Winogradskyella marina]